MGIHDASLIDAGMTGKHSHLTRVESDLIDRCMMRYDDPQSTSVNASRGNHD